MARIHRRYRKKSKKKNPPAPKKNPTALVDIAEFVGPGFAAFAVTRFGTRVIATQVAKRKPSLGKHAGALASVGSFLAAWLLAHRSKHLHKYHTPIVVGSAIAAIQSLIQLYIPRLGWMVADATPELNAAPAPTPEQIAAQEQGMGDIEVLNEDPEMYVYNDSYDPGRYGTETAGTRPQFYPSGKPANAAAKGQPASADDLLDMEMEADESQPMGIFGGQ